MSLKVNNQQEVEQLINAVDITIDGVVFHFPLNALADVIFAAIPDWLKDSNAVIPVEKPEDKTPEQIRHEQGNLEMARAAIKGFVAAIGMLPEMGHELYGPDFKLGRRDSLPLISRWMTWFIVSRLALNPAAIDTVENEDGSKTITMVRSGNGNIRTNHSKEPCRNCPPASQIEATGATGTD